MPPVSQSSCHTYSSALHTNTVPQDIEPVVSTAHMHTQCEARRASTQCFDTSHSTWREGAGPGCAHKRSGAINTTAAVGLQEEVRDLHATAVSRSAAIMDTHDQK